METSNQPTLTKPEIRQRIREEKKAIKKLKRLISQEYDLPFMDRLQNRFEFLYIEKRIHEARLTELHRKLRNEKTVIVVTWSAIGDVLVCTPALKAVRRHYHDHKIIVYCYRPEHMEVLKHNPHIDSLRLLDAKHMWKYPSHLFAFLFNKKKIPYKELDFAWIPPGWFCRKSIKYVIPQIFDVELNPDEAKTEIFFTKEEEARAIHTLAPYKNVVLMHIFARSSANHLWPLEKWAALVEQLPQFTFIQIGHTDEPQVPGALDWRGKTSLRDSFCLVKHTDSFVGVDSIHAHVTNAFDIPGVVLFGDSDPAMWGHDNNINIYKEVHCSPCFYLLWGQECTYNHECMNMITVSEVKEALIDQMKKTQRRSA